MLGEPSSHLHLQGFTERSHQLVPDPRQNIAGYSRLNIVLQVSVIQSGRITFGKVKGDFVTGGFFYGSCMKLVRSVE